MGDSEAMLVTLLLCSSDKEVADVEVGVLLGETSDVLLDALFLPVCRSLSSLLVESTELSLVGFLGLFSAFGARRMTEA